MCAPSRPSAPPAPAPAPQREPVTDKRVRRVGKTLRGGSPSQRRSLLVPMTELDVSVGGY